MNFILLIYFFFDNKEMAIAICHSSTFCVDKDGNVWNFGSTFRGRLGDSNGLARKEDPPHKIQSLSNITSIACGVDFVLLANSTGNVWAFGCNEYGQLGLGDTKFRDEPQQIQTIGNISSVYCGESHSLCLSSNGEVYSFGRNDYGQLGLGNQSSSQRQMIPKRIEPLRDVKEIAAGSEHTVLLKNDGNVLVCGGNKGKHGMGDLFDRNIPTLNKYLKNIVSISSGRNHTLVLDDNGDVFSFGDNNFGQLGLGDLDNRNLPEKITSLELPILEIYCGKDYSAVIDESGILLFFGTNANQSNSITTPTKYIDDALTVSKGQGNHIIVKSLSGVWASGINNFGVLGIPTSECDNATDKLHIPHLDKYIGKPSRRKLVKSARK